MAENGANSLCVRTRRRPEFETKSRVPEGALLPRARSFLKTTTGERGERASFRISDGISESQVYGVLVCAGRPAFGVSTQTALGPFARIEHHVRSSGNATRRSFPAGWQRAPARGRWRPMQSPHEVRINGQTAFSVPAIAMTTDVTYELAW